MRISVDFRRFSALEGPMARRAIAADASSSPQAELAARIAGKFRDRIGAERHSVWFGDEAGLHISVVPGDGGRRGAVANVVIAVGTGFTHDWLRKTFRNDFEAVVRETCGPTAAIIWRERDAAPSSPASVPAPAAQAQPPAVQSQPAADPRPSRRRHASVAASPSPAPAAGGAAASQRPFATLEGFVVGASNRMAFAAVELAATRPGEMSPLFLHGPSGVGKTHLLEAFCAQARQRHPGIATVFLSAEQFTTAFLQALHGTGLPGFRRSCRSADLLVIDDLQFLIGKRATIVEFQQTIDAVQRQGRQMVFAADRDLDALAELGSDVVVRLKGGMHASILPPDEEVRRGIVAGLAARRGLAIPDAVVQHVAQHITRHARELIGAVNRLEATSHMLGLPITPGMAEEALADLVRSSSRGVRLADIERAVCTAFGIEAGSLQSSRRSRNVNHPRMLAMFLARKHTASALTEIGSYFGRRSHSTVITAHKTVSAWVDHREQVILSESSWDVAEAIRRVEDILRVG
jgi:chromosomal replication initiator protein